MRRIFLLSAVPVHTQALFCRGMQGACCHSALPAGKTSRPRMAGCRCYQERDLPDPSPYLSQEENRSRLSL
jgi:hypothetical protein